MPTDTQNLLIPFRRDRKRDFASGAGGDLLASKVMQASMTRGFTPRSSGELPWCTAFGAGLDLLRHQRNDAVLAELARVHVRDALKRWVPEAELVGVSVTREDASLQLRVRYRSAKMRSTTQDIPAEVSLSLNL